MDRNLRDGKRELEQAKSRMHKLDEIIQKLYEDNLDGKISDDRFSKMSANYEEEQATLESRVTALQDMIDTATAKNDAAESFLKLVQGRKDVRELTAKIIREFVDKIYVHQAVDFNGHRIQQIDIAWNFIGIFDPPASDLDDTKGKSA